MDLNVLDPTFQILWTFLELSSCTLASCATLSSSLLPHRTPLSSNTDARLPQISTASSHLSVFMCALTCQLVTVKTWTVGYLHPEKRLLCSEQLFIPFSVIPSLRYVSALIYILPYCHGGMAPKGRNQDSLAHSRMFSKCVDKWVDGRWLGSQANESPTSSKWGWRMGPPILCTWGVYFMLMDGYEDDSSCKNGILAS